MTRQRYISAEEIQQLFYRPTRQQRLLTGQLIGAALLIAVGFYILVNAPAVSKQFGYWWETDIKPSRSAPSTPQELPFFASDEPAQTPGIASEKDPTLQQLANNTIYIPKINVKAPVIWDVTGGGNLNSDLLKALRHGVVRYPKTALPNQVGNVFLTGHSSDYWWEKGQYKTIFALLNRLVVGDHIYIRYNGQLYVYRVSSQKIVKPTDTSVLAPTQLPTLSLMTCTPTGTTLRRRIVAADLISPRTVAQTQSVAPQTTTIEAIR